MVYPLKSKFHFMGDHCPRLSHKVFTTLQSIHTKKESKNSHFSIYSLLKKAYIPYILLQMVYPLKSKFHFMGDHCPRLSHKVFTTLQSIHTKKESKNSHFLKKYILYHGRKKAYIPVHFASNGLPSQIKVSFHGRPLSLTIP